jgi:hypothetical protein
MHPHPAHDPHRRFEGRIAKSGFPRQETVAETYDDADLDRAIEAYRFFYPTVSGMAIWKGSEKVGLVPNRVFGLLDSQPRHVGFTLNSDTPYGPALLDLAVGPVVVEIPAGPLMAFAIDVHQRWVADMGLPGPDAGQGGKHLLLPPGFQGEVPAGYHVSRSSTNRLILGVRSLPVGGDVAGAFARIKTIKIRPLAPSPEWSEPRWVDLTDKPQDTTPLAWEANVDYWKVLHEAIDTEPPFAGYAAQYGELAALGILKGKRFAPDARLKHLLEEAAQGGKAELCAQSFADRRPDRVVWPDRQWEWAALRYEGGDFATDSHTDLEAREKWFYQAIGASPAMFRRAPGAGSLYWLGVRDRDGAFLDGAKSYKLVVPRPVPCELFWSVTVYDAETRSQIQTKQQRAALRSLFELSDVTSSASAPVELYFAPHPPPGDAHDNKARRWIQTIPGKGWFTYFRVYGPETAIFDGSWKPGDLTLL